MKNKEPIVLVADACTTFTPTIHFFGLNEF